MGDKTRIVEEICDFIRGNISGDLSLSSLEKRFGVSRFTILRSFKDIMGITPRKYVEECRIHKLKINLKEGQVLPKAVYNTGYNSHSWLYEDAMAKLGMLPSSYRDGGRGETVRYRIKPCRLGLVMVAETDYGICALSIADSEEDLVRSLKSEYNKAQLVMSESVDPQMEKVLDYFDGQLLNLPVAVKGTEFQRRVWAAILTIPYGETRSYNEVAEMVGNPKAYRAVANACASNPVPLIVPCHRVLRKNGDMGGYALGLHRKKYLLDMERRKMPKFK